MNFRCCIKMLLKTAPPSVSERMTIGFPAAPWKSLVPRFNARFPEAQRTRSVEVIVPLDFPFNSQMNHRRIRCRHVAGHGGVFRGGEPNDENATSKTDTFDTHEKGLQL